MNYRSDIQILRGISVLFVVLYHFSVDAFANGFLGVDIFFVISGFLMAVLYNHEKRREFFEKRARRLLPAYYIVILFTLTISFLVNSPNETGQVVRQAGFATVFMSNIGFWIQNSYFSKSEFNPLLHLWSLGVEIQFYLCMPIFAWWIRRSRKKYFVILLASFTLCMILISISPKTSFFMMPTRLWEFFLGFGAAYFLSENGEKRKIKSSWIKYLPVIVILMIPLFPLNGQSLDPLYGHPGIVAFVIACSTAIILLFGLPSLILHSKIGNSLELLGKYSYSIYLVHFPIIVLSLSSPFSETVLDIGSNIKFLEIAVLVLISSFGLFHLVENRFKTIKLLPLLVGFPISIAIFAISLSTLQKQIIPLRDQYIFDAFSDRSVYRCGKMARIISPQKKTCQLNESYHNSKADILLVGDSHADSIKTTMSNAASANQVNLYFMVANNPLLSRGLNTQSIVDEANDLGVSQIYLHYSPSAKIRDQIKDLFTLALHEGLNVVFIEPVPIWPVHIPQALYKNTSFGDPLPTQTLIAYNDTNKKLLSTLDQISHPHLKRISVSSIFCTPGCAIVSVDGKPYYFDSGHLTLTGSQLLSSALDGQIKTSLQLQ